ncbi:MAG: hypothetical protein DLM66_13705 [Candidatus Dormiibacter spiritus]|nr:MAG: hypothetical protein DLM66_13705 [Candidatus Dormibacteraeota bacterium]
MLIISARNGGFQPDPRFDWVKVALKVRVVFEEQTQSLGSILFILQCFDGESAQSSSFGRTANRKLDVAAFHFALSQPRRRRSLID